MLCLVRYLFVISTSVIDRLVRFVPEMTYYVSSGMLNLTKLKLPSSQQLNAPDCHDNMCSHSNFPYMQGTFLLREGRLVIST